MNFQKPKNVLLPIVLPLMAMVFTIHLSLAQRRVLVFSKTEGFRHASIEAGKSAFQKMAAEKGFSADFTEDATQFATGKLNKYQAVIFLNTTGNVLNDQQQAEFERYIQAGGGYLGIHSATDCEYDWAWYGRLAGAYFLDHPNPNNVQKGKFYVVQKDHWATKGMPDEFERTDEFYSFRQIDPTINVLVKIDEKSYQGGKNGDNHPMSWYHEFDGGRAFYTAMGHTDETFSEPLFLDHVWAGLQYVMGGDSPAPLDYSKSKPEENRFSKVILKEKLNEPMELSVLNDGRILYIERHGALRAFNTLTRKTKTIATIPVSTKYTDKDGKVSEAEDGLLGLNKDPNFAINHWIYLYYSDPVKSQNVLARYTLVGDALDVTSKKVLLEIPTQREQCCHTAGSIAWDKDGNLYLSTGDNTNPHGSNGYSPSDERPDRGPWDAQKSSSNTNDLRGKIIRIKPLANGKYSIPKGNLFAPGTEKTRPEIYTMGHRNPFRISVDKKTGYLYWGEVGPDANAPDSLRGPAGQDEVGLAKTAGNQGWPYFVGDNKPYTRYDFAQNLSLGKWQADKPINASPNNTGLMELPPAQKALIWYPYGESKEFPLVGNGGRNAMAGPVFYSADYNTTARAFPEYYNGKLFTYDWMRGWIMAVTLDKEGNFANMERFMPSYKFSNPMDMEFAANGDLYMLEYGSGWFSANDDARLVRIEYNGGNRKPQVSIAADKMGGSVPFTVNLSSAGTMDADGDSLTYSWRVSSPTGYVKTVQGPTAKLTLDKANIYKATLTVTYIKGAISRQSLELTAGNETPVVSIDLGENSKSFYFPDKVYQYKVNVVDKEDGTLAEGKIKPEEIVVNIDYLAEGFDKTEIVQGHRTAESAVIHLKGKTLIDGSDCKVCHNKEKKSIGPAYREIAIRYKDKAGMAQNLSKKIISGGNGNWGEVAMAGHPQISAEDAAEMAKYILGLEEKPKIKSLPVQGTHITKAIPNDKGQGVYIFRAAYKDRGANGLPSITSEETITLRNPSINPTKYDEFFNVNKMSFNGNSFVIPTKHGSYIGLKQIDLAGIQEVQLMAVAPKAQLNAEGGVVELHIDAPNGILLGKTDFIGDAGTGFVPKPVSLKIQPTKGLHDIYLVFQNPGAKSGASLMVVMNTVFKSGESVKTEPVAIKPDTDLAIYTGKYKMTGLPFPYIEISLKEGKLMIDAGGQTGEIQPTGEPNLFDAGGKAKLLFIPDETNKINKLKMDAMGFSFEGVKE